MFASNLAIRYRILRGVIGLALIAGFFLLLGWSTRDGGGGGAAHA